MLPMPLPPAAVATTSQVQIRQTTQAYVEHLASPSVPPNEVEEILEFATAHPSPDILMSLARRTTGRQLEATLRAAVALRASILHEIGSVITPDQARSLSATFRADLADSRDFSTRSFASTLGTLSELPSPRPTPTATRIQR